MSATTATIGFGVSLARGDGASPEVFTDIAEVIDISGPSLSRDAVEATHTASPNRWREFISGLKDGGEVTLDVNHLPNNATQSAASGGIVGEFATTDGDTPTNFELTFPVSPAVAWTLPLITTGFEPATPIDDRMVGSMTGKVSGEPTLA